MNNIIGDFLQRVEEQRLDGYANWLKTTVDNASGGPGMGSSAGPTIAIATATQGDQSEQLALAPWQLMFLMGASLVTGVVLGRCGLTGSRLSALSNHDLVAPLRDD